MLLLVALGTPARAQGDGPYVLTAAVIAGGGSTAGADTDYTASFTIGQPLAGPMMSMAGGEYAVATGFWPVQEAGGLPTPTATGTTANPTLTATSAPVSSTTPSAVPTTPTPTVVVNATVTPTTSAVRTAVATNTPTATHGPTPPPCAGDCNGDGSVTVDELLTLGDIALGKPGSCPSGVPPGATVDISLIITAVNHALAACGG